MNEKIQHFAAGARNLLLQNRTALLSTLAIAHGGSPFGSIVPYDVTPEGDFIVYLSLIAEHYKNLAYDPRGSILVANYFAYDDPQAFGRATAICRFTPVAEAEQERIRCAYRKKFHDSVNDELAHNFVLLRGVPEKIRWIRGFGEMGWISIDQYRAASPDPLAQDSWGIIQHMNEDHADALHELAQYFGGYSTHGGSIGIVELDSLRFTMAHRTHGNRRLITCDFPSPVIDAESARASFMAMLEAARASVKPRE